MNQELVAVISGLAGAIISLLTMYVKGFNTWFAGLDPKVKPLVMLGFNALATGILVGLSCAKLTDVIVCDEAGLVEVAWVFLYMVLGNQAAFLLSPQPKPVREAKENRRRSE